PAVIRLAPGVDAASAAAFDLVEHARTAVMTPVRTRVVERAEAVLTLGVPVHVALVLRRARGGGAEDEAADEAGDERTRDARIPALVVAALRHVHTLDHAGLIGGALVAAALATAVRSLRQRRERREREDREQRHGDETVRGVELVHRDLRCKGKLELMPETFCSRRAMGSAKAAGVVS